MRKHNFLTRTSAFILCTSIILSALPNINFTSPVEPVETKAAESSTDEYANETLEHMWDGNNDGDPDDAFLKAARPNYACRNDSFGGVEYRTIFHVYAFEGDTICVGSSVYDSQLNINHTKVSSTVGDKGSVDVVMTDLNGVSHSIDIRNSDDDKTGYIPDWQTEYAAVKGLHKENGKFVGEYTDATSNTYTYTPYTYNVIETGVYTFEFHSYNKSGGNNNAKQRNGSFSDTKTSGLIAALNLTVFNESGEEQHGRTYADFLSLEMDPTNNIGVKDSYYILTKDSYIYKMQFNNAIPYTYNFFSNNKGLYDSATGEIIYTSVKDVNNKNTYARMGAAYKYPGTKDTDMLKSYYIFLEYPDDRLEGEIYEKPVQPDPATNLRFVSQIKDESGNKIPGAYEGEGGYFAFDVDEATTATLRLEFKNTEAEDSFAPVEISGAVTPHSTNYFYWNGKDGNGTVIPKNKYLMENLAFTVTTKAGEIHFPIIDMECAPGGITFTRMSHIYDKNGTRLDADDNIYGKTKNLIYYDDTAIYYGEMAASTGFSESNVDVAKDKFTTSDGMDGQYYNYNNIGNANGGENIVRNAKSEYVTKNKIRIGDHSHTTNVVNYFDTDGKLLKGEGQEDILDYLDSAKYPVGQSTGDYSTTDYAIANFWTFIPSKPATASVDIDSITITERPENYFNLTGRVFFDANSDGLFKDMSQDGDYAMSGVTLNLYKKTNDKDIIEGETYVNYNSDNTLTALNAESFPTAENKYMLVDTGLTTGDGIYKFTSLNYDPKNGTEYIYEVIKPSKNYTLKSGSITAKPLEHYEDKILNQYYGYYSNKSFNNSYKGTEVQKIVVGGSEGVDPTKLGYSNEIDKKIHENPDHTVCAVDVGYNYKTLDRSLVLKKEWKTKETNATHPAAVVYQLSYKLERDTGSYIYDYYTLSAITSWQKEDEYLPAELGGKNVDNYYVSAEYYIDNNAGKIYRHTYNDYNNATGKYESFVANKTYSVDLSTLFKDGTVPADCKVTDLPDLNDDGYSDAKDMGEITEWKEDTNPKYTAVLDRDMRSDNTTVTITNAEQPGTIEILKYYDTPKEGNYLQGATFRVYVGTMEEIKALNGDVEGLREKQVASGSTRSNGRVAFPGLDPTKTYTVREVYAPDGYRILEEYYEVKPKKEDLETDSENVFYFDEKGYAFHQIGNALADKEFKIRKQILGRAWQSDDKFTFNIKPMFDGNDLNKEGEFNINDAERLLYTDDAVLLDKLGAFVEEFSSCTKVVNSDNAFYSFTTQQKDRPDITYNSSDTKVSDTLITNEGNARFCDFEFPFAGTYTFSVSELDEADKNSTLETSKRIYTVEITVNRVLNTGATGELDLGNSHLTAEVSKITYTEGDDTTSKVFAGSSPLFTNTYTPAPAAQSTSYAIKKIFNGRPEGGYNSSDKFTVRIKGTDDVTQEAIANKNLSITGLGDPKASGEGAAMEWTHDFTKEQPDNLNFNYFIFNNITFPVQYVDKEGNPYEPTDDKPTPDDEELESGKYTAQTMPVTYWLEISEDKPDEVNGITYDENKYYLEIILRNTEKGTITNEAEEEEDGIIEEIDLYLYKNDKESAVANCITNQHVVNESEWKTGSETDVTWCYVDKNGKLRDGKDMDTPPAGAKLLIKRKESHEGPHEMTFTNTYAASYTWTPKITKILNGRNWLSADKFEFTMTYEDETGVIMPEDNKVLITKEDTSKQFKSVTFTAPGEYKFKFKEKDVTGITEKNSGTYEITVKLKDDGKGSLYGEVGEGDAIELSNTNIEFVNTYADKENKIGFAMTKNIEGRPFNDGEEFSFKIVPSEKAKEAIRSDVIEMPTELATDIEGNYTFSVTADASEVTNTIVKTLGDIVVKKGEEELQQYKFTISENTDGFDEKDMKCFENDIRLTLNVERELKDGLPTGELKVSAAYAYISDDGPIETEAINIPFRNICMGSLTVKKEVWNDAAKGKDFTFEAEFECPEGTASIPGITVYDMSGEELPIAFNKTSEGKYTGTFTLQNTKHIVIKDIPPYTQYTIREKDIPEDYLLLRVTNGTETPEITENGVSGKLENSRLSQSLSFVNAKFYSPFPGTGGKGRHISYALGVLMLIISGVLKKRTAKNNGI